jgi:uncharacterized protein YfaS (alpha-2-macroglobulin family)
MLGKVKASVLVGLLFPFAAALLLTAADPPASEPRRESLMKTFNAGNYKDAYDGLRKLALDPQDDPAKVGDDLNTAVQCLQYLGRSDEMDDFREAVIDVHKSNWRLLDAAAQNYANFEHYGYIVAGKFYRGNHRGGGRYVGTMERDRVRALQLMQQALPLNAKETDKHALAEYHLHFANLLLNGGGYHEPWRLQYLTDLTKLPDYDEAGRGIWRDYSTVGAPVDADGNPVYHKMPKTYEAAATDGERWRWMLSQVAEYEPKRVNEMDVIFANFLREQFGVQTMAYYGWNYQPDEDDKAENKSGTYALHTLNDEETIARLANGIRRFKLPDEFNFIKVYERVAGRGKSNKGGEARDFLAGVYEDRRQYVKAADAWKKAIEEYGKGQDNYRQQRLDQIEGNWGRFESGRPQPYGTEAVVDFRFRNGKKVSFEAHAINVPKLLDDVKAYLTNHTGNLEWERINLNNIGYRLVEQNQKQYLGEKVAAWDEDLKPRPSHVDERVTVKTPMKKPGAYLLTATMAGGNTSRIIVWVSDTIILKKTLDGKVFYYACDAVTGQPVAKAKVDFFGYKQVQVAPNTNNWKVETRTHADTTDADGQLILGPQTLPNDYQWVVTARKDKANRDDGDRFAYLGFSGVWFGQFYDPDYNQIKVFTITDRPVYRPLQTVQFKFWVRHAKYDQPDTSDFANQPFTVRIDNPKGEKVFEKTFAADEYGGLSGELPLPKDAMLGVYHLQILNRGGGSFRVEEYKKPEYEVTVDAPKEPVMLGEKIEATVTAKYYFGAPVTNAKVKYKVLRTSHSARWYPRGNWDWFYGKGYWWFACDYPWYPGFAEWGCMRPIPIWWGRWSNEQPEVVLENEVPIGPDGTIKIAIDTTAAKELHGNQDHQYSISATVVDESRRNIDGAGTVLVARKPFQVFSWVNRGHYRVGDTVEASFAAQTLDQKPVEGKGELKLYSIAYGDKNEPWEKTVETWKIDTDAQGQAHQKIKAAKAGQYRLSYKVTDAKNHTIEGGYVFVVRGDGFDGKEFRFNDVEIITDKREYSPGEKVKLMVNTNKADSSVLLFIRPTNGVYLPPQLLTLKGKSIEQEVLVVQKDMPNFYIEAVTVANGQVHSEVREVIVPPEKRVVNVEVLPSAKEYKPGEKATVKVKLTDLNGKPFVGSTAVSMYDKSVEYISGGSNVPEIKEFFWKWRRHHYPQTETSLNHYLGNLLRNNERGMSNLGVFGEQVVDELSKLEKGSPKEMAFERTTATFGMAAPPAGPGGGFGGGPRGAGRAGGEQLQTYSNVGAVLADGVANKRAESERADQPPAPPPGTGPEPVVRKNFTDTAFWNAAITTNPEGVAEISLTMPENLTGWKMKVWAMGHGTRVGQGETEVVTKKNLLVRLQAPRFFVQKDEVVLSANVHNYLKGEKKAAVTLDLKGGTLAVVGEAKQLVTIAANGEKRVDWRVKVLSEGDAIVTMKAVTDEESDAMQMRFPCFVHGMLKTDSFSAAIRPDKDSAFITLTVPAERRINDTRLEIRYSPTLAGAMVDALPYMVEYPYGCTEQTLNRFLPTVVTQHVLQRMNLDLKDIEKKRTNLNAQEIGDDTERAKGWKRFPHNPVFNEEEVKDMTRAGIQALAGMQLSDGGWGWFSGFGEHSSPHTTAVVVHGLQIARANDVKLPDGMLERGIEWLKRYQAEQILHIKNAPNKVNPYKEKADNLDAFVYMVLVDGSVPNDEMQNFLYRDRTSLAVYAKAMYGLALHKQGQAEKLAMILKNIEQFVVLDDENQTAYLKLPGDNYWWCWYGSEVEADAYYLKLLSLTNAKDEKASRFVKYLLNNRKHATYWNSTRDTAICIEAMAEYLKASGEDKPDLTVEILLDGKKVKEVKIDKSNLFTFDNKLVMVGDAVESGKHTVEVRKKGTGPVYFNAYLTNFTLEDHITKAGLEVKVNRKYYKLTREDKEIQVPGSRGQPAGQKVEKYKRTELAELAQLKSGDLVEVELEIDSKNDYEYIVFEDPKAAGFEPVQVRSGYNPNDLGAYMELRDEKVCFFVRALARGKHSVAYRLRAEIPGKFSALPTQASAMYAPELKGNSDEIKLIIAD